MNFAGDCLAGFIGPFSLEKQEEKSTQTSTAKFQKGRKGAGVKGAGVANCRIFRSAVPSVVVWSILLVSLSGVKKKL